MASSTSSPPSSVPPSTRSRLVSADPPLDDWWIGKLYGFPLSSVIVSILVDLCFLPSFTLPSTPVPFVVRHDLHLGRCWAAGAGFPPKLSSTSYAQSANSVSEEWELDSNRVEVLRCVLAAVASSMFSPRVLSDDPFVTALVSAPHELSTTLAFSLLNVLLGYRAEAILPYAYALSTDYRAPLVELSSHILLILLDCAAAKTDSEDSAEERDGTNEARRRQLSAQGASNGHAATDVVLTEDRVEEKHPPRSVSSSSTTSNSSSSSSSSSAPLPSQRPPAVSIPDDGSVSASAVTTQRHAEPSLQQQAEHRRALSLSTASHSNVFVERLFSLSPADQSYLFTSVCRLLHYGMQSGATYLPGSSSGITIEAELFVLLWKYLDCDPTFLSHLLEHCDVLALVTPSCTTCTPRARTRRAWG